jgi:putative flavoprotein involved in K+ transport
VTAYLRQYAEFHELAVEVNRAVEAVHADGRGFVIESSTGERWQAHAVIAATGSFAAPNRPDLPGLAGFAGSVLHSSEYRNPAPFVGKRVIVVGAGNSAVQIAHELAQFAEVTITSREPIRFLPQRPFGVDLHDWLHVSGLDRVPFGSWGDGTWVPRPRVLDPGLYRSGVAAGRPVWRPMFTGLGPDYATWSVGLATPVDGIILATGFRPSMPYLAGVGAGVVDEQFRPRQRAGLSLAHPGIGFVGMEGQRTAASATLRGVGPDADHVVGALAGRLRDGVARGRCCQAVPG